MNNLFIYGCSFSDFFLPHMVDKFWFKIVEKHFNLELKHRAVSGYGWHRIRATIFKEAYKWKEDDLIIISPSVFGRVDIIDFSVDKPSWNLDDPYVRYIDDFDKRYRYYHDDYVNTIKTLRLVNQNVYTWSLDKIVPEFMEESYVITPPDDHESWMIWNLSDKRNWIVPYPHPGGDNGTMIDRDTHFSSHAHRIVAEQMIKQIQK